MQGHTSQLEAASPGTLASPFPAEGSGSESRRGGEAQGDLCGVPRFQTSPQQTHYFLKLDADI